MKLEAMKNMVNYYYANEAGSIVVGLTIYEAAKAREENIDLGHTTHPGKDDHNEFAVKKKEDRDKLKELFG